MAPARRAFTKQELAAVLTRSGFAVEGWLCEGGTFVACVARRIEDPMLEGLERAGALASAGQFTEARLLLESLRTPDLGALAKSGAAREDLRRAALRAYLKRTQRS